MFDYLPFTNDYGGNPICVKVKTGKVYIVWIDLGKITTSCFCYLAESFDEFIDGLAEESIDDWRSSFKWRRRILMYCQ